MKVIMPKTTMPLLACHQCLRELYENSSQYYRKHSSKWRVRNAEEIKRLRSFTPSELEIHRNTIHNEHGSNSSSSDTIRTHRQSMQAAVAARQQYMKLHFPPPPPPKPRKQQQQQKKRKAHRTKDRIVIGEDVSFKLQRTRERKNEWGRANRDKTREYQRRWLSKKKNTK